MIGEWLLGTGLAAWLAGQTHRRTGPRGTNTEERWPCCLADPWLALPCLASSPAPVTLPVIADTRASVILYSRGAARAMGLYQEDERVSVRRLLPRRGGVSQASMSVRQLSRR